MTNILLQSLDKYYNNGKNMDNFNDYVNGDKKISLRIIDWFVTNYSKKYTINALYYRKIKFWLKPHKLFNADMRKPLYLE